jgi:hypothetical protein
MIQDAPNVARLYRNVALIECADAAALGEVLAGVAGRHLVRWLSDTVVVVDHAQVEPILKALRKAGYTPRVSGAAGGAGVSGEER